MLPITGLRFVLSGSPNLGEELNLESEKVSRHDIPSRLVALCSGL
jgi:hypothetical protein